MEMDINRSSRAAYGTATANNGGDELLYQSDTLRAATGAQACVDGELAVEDITPDLRAQVKTVMQSLRHIILGLVLVTAVGVLVVGLVIILVEFIVSGW